jgi:hypothetical protein
MDKHLLVLVALFKGIYIKRLGEFGDLYCTRNIAEAEYSFDTTKEQLLKRWIGQDVYLHGDKYKIKAEDVAVEQWIVDFTKTSTP